jgi:predicted RNase H-like HicB family nuclease/DNA-binding XRE family transcriptional regulator
MFYTAIITHDDGSTIAAFPDCPGCVTQADEGEDIRALAAEALEGWLEVSLEAGDAPAPPSAHDVAVLRAGEVFDDVTDAEAIDVPVPAALAVRLQVRWARQAEGLSQAQLAERLGVSRQQAANIEAADANLRLSTLERVADHLGYTLDVRLVKRVAAS